MTTLFSIILLGFFLGMRHATDADHVVAVTNFVSRERSVRSATLIGLVWGIGHTLSIVIVGGAIIVFGFVVPPKLGLSFEFGVALMLIVLGIMNVDSFLRLTRQRLAGQNRSEGAPDSAPTQEDRMRTWLESKVGQLGLPQIVRPLVVGMVHGLAGSAALALLVLPMIPDTGWAMLYLLIFGAGSIVGMMVITAALAVPCAYFANGSQALSRWLGAAAGVLSLGFGLFLVYQIGFVEGLFLASHGQ